MSQPNLEQITDTEAIEILKTVYKVKVEVPAYTELPKIKIEYQKSDKQSLERIKHYLLHTYVINDGFDKDDNARVKLKEKIYLDNKRVASWLDKSNKLRYNEMLGTYSAAYLLAGAVKSVDKELSERLKEHIKQNPGVDAKVYSQSTFAEKTAVAKKFDKFFYQFLELLS